MAQRLQRSGLAMREVTFVGKNLDKMATTLLEIFRSRKIDLYDDRLLVRDLSRLTIVEKHFGHKLEAVSDADGHADRAIALAIAAPLAIDLPRMPAWCGAAWFRQCTAHRGRALATQFSSRRHIRHPHLKGLIYEQLQ